MADILGADLLTNSKISGVSEVKISDMETIDLPTISLDSSDPPPPPPKLFPSVNEVGPMQTNDGFQNMNADTFTSSFSNRRMSEENTMKEKYELLRKFERLTRMGVPMRKRFTLDSPIDEMKMELEFMKREKQMDQTIKQFCDWYITGMSAMEWSSKNVSIMKAFGLQLDGLSESAQMNVVDMEEDFEELYEMYGDKMKMHPLVRIPIRTCMMVYMVHLTNQMARKAPIPNIDDVLRTNPDIARQLATAAMQQQTQSMRSSVPQQPSVGPPPPSGNPLAGLANFMSSMVPPPPPQQTSVRPPPQAPIRAVRLPKPNPQPPAAAIAPPPAPAREMSAPINIDDLLAQVNKEAGTKKVTMNVPEKKKGGGSTGKNSVSIKL